MGREQQIKFSRKVEDWGAIIGISLVALHAVLNMALDAAYALGVAEHHMHAAPWWLFFVYAVLVVPKMIGRATAGEGWLKLIDKLPFGRHDE